MIPLHHDCDPSEDRNCDGVPDECEHRCDLNCDGLVNGLDIDPFVKGLTNPYEYRRQY